MNDDILLALKKVIDPELGLNVVDLGLVYRAECGANGIEVVMAMTSPACPLGGALLEGAEPAASAQHWLDRRQYPAQPRPASDLRRTN